MKGTTRKLLILLLAALFVFVAAACGNNSNNGNTANNTAGAENNEPAADLSGDVRIEGSSTVLPISQAVSEEYQGEQPDVNITVNGQGTSTGFKALAAGEAEIAGASRQVKEEETAAITDDELVELPVAYDGITVVIHPDNDWAEEMSVEDLAKIWAPGSTVKNWSDVNPEWPNEPITLYGPGTASGTFEYFTEEINGEAGASRDDYNASEDDNTLVRGVESDEFALGYFGFAYFMENEGKLKAVKIKETADAEAIEPSTETIADGSYKPLSRTLYLYAKKGVVAKPEVNDLLKFYVSDIGKELITEVGYVPLPQEMYDEYLTKIQG